jgi:hypothetical protein
MKKLLLWLLPLSFLWAACQKEIATPDRTDLEQKKFGAVENGVKKPAKGEMFSIPRFDLPPMTCIPGSPMPGGMYMGGWGTGTEEIQLMKSPFFMDGCEFDPQTMTLIHWGHGTVTIENGDSYFITGRVISNMANMTFTGDVIINDGTGKYKGAYGEVKMYDGWVDMNTGTNHWKYDGWVIFKKK